MTNLNHPKRVAATHQEYIKAGTDTTKASTLSASEQHLECNWKTVRRILQEGYHIAKEAVKDKTGILADTGPIMEQKNVSLVQQYQQIADVFLVEGADCFLFETLLNT